MLNDLGLRDGQGAADPRLEELLNWAIGLSSAAVHLNWAAWVARDVKATFNPWRIYLAGAESDPQLEVVPINDVVPFLERARLDEVAGLFRSVLDKTFVTSESGLPTGLTSNEVLEVFHRLLDEGDLSNADSLLRLAQGTDWQPKIHNSTFTPGNSSPCAEMEATLLFRGWRLDEADERLRASSVRSLSSRGTKLRDDLDLLLGRRMAEPDLLERYLEHQLGPAVWSRLREDTRSTLTCGLAAALQWRVIPWAASSLLFRAFEGELRSRMKRSRVPFEQGDGLTQLLDNCRGSVRLRGLAADFNARLLELGVGYGSDRLKGMVKLRNSTMHPDQFTVSDLDHVRTFMLGTPAERGFFARLVEDI